MPFVLGYEHLAYFNVQNGCPLLDSVVHIIGFLYLFFSRAYINGHKNVHRLFTKDTTHKKNKKHKNYYLQVRFCRMLLL